MTKAANSEFLLAAKNRVLVVDGAMGTSIHQFSLDLAKDYLGHENCGEILNFTRPDIVGQVHERFLAAGCDAVETNTFGANAVVLAEFAMADRVEEMNQAAAKIARAACEKYSTPQRRRFVIGSMGPGTRLPSLGHIGFDDLYNSYLRQCHGLIDGGVDVLLLETCQDLLLAKAAINAATDAMSQRGVCLPLMVQVTIESFGTMLVGSEMSAVIAALSPYEQVDVLGINCATGPAEMAEAVAALSENWPRLISVQPNAGLPSIVDGAACYPLQPAEFAQSMRQFVQQRGVNIVGGCCGTTAAHLKALVEAVADCRPAPRDPRQRPSITSLYSAEDIRQQTSYLVVAERTNTNGSKKFRQLLEAEDWDGLVSMARQEVRDGSHLLDVCVDFVGRDGVSDMRQVISRLVRQVHAPLMLDSTDAAVMEAGLKLAAGRCVLNSTNLEEGEERFARICALAKRYAAALVAGTIDEDKQNAMARTAQRKEQIALRMHALATEKSGLRDQDLFFDPLVLPISTGLEDDRANGHQTIEGIRRISQKLPNCHTIIGLSNISFGLKPPARVVLNSAFLHECLQAGLTGAIAHASKILPRNRIPDQQWDAALDLIYDRRRPGFDPLTHYIGLFADAAASSAAADADDDLPIEQRLRRHIIDGEKRHLTEHLQQAMQDYTPLQIINEHLLAGMKTVGELFGSGKMQLPFVLQSAETMKASVAFLEPFMEKVQGSGKGRIVLATVKGDVHDIGKNLVDIILSNNGYTVYNLGIKQPVAAILQAAREKQADAIGMSGLLVKSVAVMKENLEMMNSDGLSIPVLLGGAALTRDYAENDLAGTYAGPLFYCKDAFEGLTVMDTVAAGQAAAAMEKQNARAQRRREQRQAAKATAALRPASSLPAAKVQSDHPVPMPPFWGSRLVENLNPGAIFAYINELALFRGQWGFKKGALSDEEFANLTEQKARPVFLDLQRRAVAEGWLGPKVAYGYFPVQADGEDVVVLDPREFCAGDGTPQLRPHQKPRPILRFSFPRQQSGRRLCISDFFRPASGGEFDVLGLQVVTVGQQASELTAALFKENRYQDYLYLHGFSVESAEALAEYQHKQMRGELGLGGEDGPEIADLFHQRYRGSRYSFGYGACPDLEQRAKIMELLDGGRIGVSLTENFMLSPEQSTDALVVHHPQAKYFDVE